MICHVFGFRIFNSIVSVSVSVWFYFCIFLHRVQNKLLFTTNKQNQIDKIEKWYIFCDICCNLKLKNMHERLNYIIMSDVVESLFTQLIIPNMELFWLVSYLTKTPKFLLWLLVIDIFKMTISLACIPPVELILFDFFFFYFLFSHPRTFQIFYDNQRALGSQASSLTSGGGGLGSV